MLQDLSRLRKGMVVRKYIKKKNQRINDFPYLKYYQLGCSYTFEIYEISGFSIVLTFKYKNKEQIKSTTMFYKT